MKVFVMSDSIKRVVSGLTAGDSMLRNVQNISDSDSPQMCRLCLVEEEDLIYIFDPKGYHGYQMWEIMKELLQMEVSKEDGLPWTICHGCVVKVKEFKDFKTTCIRAKISFLRMIANSGFVSGLATNSPTSPLEKPTKAIWKRRSSRTSGKDSNGVEVVVKEENTVMSEDEDSHREIDVKEEIEETDESLSDTETCDGEHLGEGESNYVGVSRDASVAVPLHQVNVKEEVTTSESLSEVENIGEENPHESESSNDSVSNESSPLEMQDTKVDCNLAGGSPKTCGKIVGDVRVERQEITQTRLKRNTSLSGLPGGHPGRNSSTISAVISKHQAKNNFSAKEDGKLKTKRNITCTPKLNDMKRYELRNLGSREEQLTRCTEYICDYCGVKYRDKKQLLVHIRCHISKNRSSTCLTPEDPSPRCSESRIATVQGLIPFKCGTCGKNFKSEGMLARHSVVHTNRFKCDTCGKGFKKKTVMRQHLIVHSNLRPFKCEMCGKEFKQKGGLQRHCHQIHIDSKPFICDKCGKGFRGKYNLQLHSAVHLESKPFKCNTCGKDFKRKCNLREHCLIHIDSKVFMCEKCGKGFRHRHELKMHSAVHLELKPFKCETCDKEFSKKSSLKNHLVLHSGRKRFKCETCKKGFFHKNNLVSHLLTHRGLKPYRCETCGKGFSFEKSWASHATVHSEFKPYKCATCGREFKWKNSLRTHSAIHSDLKPFKCDVCGMGFKLKRGLVLHSVMHTSSIPFKCKTCGKSFKTKTYLQKHSIVHNKSKPFKCKVCGKEYYHKSTLVKHSSTHT